MGSHARYRSSRPGAYFLCSGLFPSGGGVQQKKTDPLEQIGERQSASCGACAPPKDLPDWRRTATQIPVDPHRKIPGPLIDVRPSGSVEIQAERSSRTLSKRRLVSMIPSISPGLPPSHSIPTYPKYSAAKTILIIRR